MSYPALALALALLKPAIINCPSPNGEPRPRGEHITTIVIHDTEESRKKVVLSLFQSRRFGKTPHYTIDKQGHIYQHIPDQSMGAHAGRSKFHGRYRVNYFSLGVELINKGDGKDPFPAKQIASLVSLVAWLAHTYNVPLESIVGHRDIAIPRGRKSDPARNFKFPEFLKRVQDKLNSD